MSQRNYQLKINNPCKQDWDTMQQNENGKFCSHCSKTVIDFTKMSNSDIIQVLEQKSGNLCGRLSEQQLNHNTSANQISNYSSLYKILTGVFLAGSTLNSNANNKPTFQTHISSYREIIEGENQHLEKTAESLSDSLKNVVRGTIVDGKTNEPLIYVTVIIKDSKTGVVTDNEGNFRLNIPEHLITEKIVLIASYVGYLKVEISINKNELPIKNKLITMYPSTIRMGEVCLVKKKKWWQFWK